MQNRQRLDSFDSIRLLMVLLILLLHAACAYSLLIPWWHAQDAQHLAFDLIIIVLDTFALPVLFFIAGIFAWPSLSRHGLGGFVLGKAKRLMLPVIVLSSFYLPAMVYMGYLARTEQPDSFLSYWIHWMASFSDWSAVFIDSMESGMRYADIYSPHHLWFLSMLFLFFLGYGLFKTVMPVNRKKEIHGSLLLALPLAAMIVSYAALNTQMQDWAWARVGPLLPFQPTRVPIYLISFIMGTLARPRLEKGMPMPGKIWMWVGIFLGTLGLYLGVMPSLMNSPENLSLQAALAHGALRSVLAVSAICFWINLGHRFLSTQASFLRSLAASSYDIYILHMPVTVFVQAAFLGSNLPLGIKMLVAFVVPALLFWGLSRTMARTGAWFGALLLAVFFLGFILLY